MSKLFIEEVDWDELKVMVDNLSDDEVITIDFRKDDE